MRDPSPWRWLFPLPSSLSSVVVPSVGCKGCRRPLCPPPSSPTRQQMWVPRGGGVITAFQQGACLLGLGAGVQSPKGVPPGTSSDRPGGH